MKYKSKKRLPKTKTRRMRMSKRMTKRRSINQKGGLFNMSLGLNGMNLFGKTYGKKYYDNGVWKNQTCNKVLGIEYCTLDKETEQPTIS